MGRRGGGLGRHRKLYSMALSMSQVVEADALAGGDEAARSEVHGRFSRSISRTSARCQAPRFLLFALHLLYIYVRWYIGGLSRQFTSSSRYMCDLICRPPETLTLFASRRCRALC